MHPRRWKLFTRHSEHPPPSQPRNHSLSSSRFYAGLPLFPSVRRSNTATPTILTLALAPLFSFTLVRSSRSSTIDYRWPAQPPQRGLREFRLCRWAHLFVRPTSSTLSTFTVARSLARSLVHLRLATFLRVIIVPFRGVFPNSYPISLLAFQFMAANRFVRRADPLGSLDYESKGTTRNFDG